MTEPFFQTSVAGGAERVSFDAGLRVHMQRVFSYMAGGLALTGALAYMVAGNAALMDLIFGTPLRWVVMLAPFAFIMVMNFKIQTMRLSTLQAIFWAFCGTMGISLASIFIAYVGEDIARAFFGTAAMFGGMSLWGYATKRDLTGMGAFLMMGLLGLFIMSLVNIFLGSSTMQWVVSVASVGIFTGLTAYDVQKIKQGYASAWGAEANNKMAVMGALTLYLDFINIFISLLRLTSGGRRD